MRLDEDGNAYKVDFVSIHASVKDATAVMYGNLLSTKVSIHASVKDATPYMTAGTKAKAFQSTHL